MTGVPSGISPWEPVFLTPLKSSIAWLYLLCAHCDRTSLSLTHTPRVWPMWQLPLTPKGFMLIILRAWVFNPHFKSGFVMLFPCGYSPHQVSGFPLVATDSYLPVSLSSHAGGEASWEKSSHLFRAPGLGSSRAHIKVQHPLSVASSCCIVLTSSGWSLAMEPPRDTNASSFSKITPSQASPDKLRVLDFLSS